MSRKAVKPDFVCPNCGADVPGKALACPECGADENTGWSDETYLDGVNLPWAEEETDEKPKSGVLQSATGLWVVVAAVLLAIAVFMLLGGAIL